MLWKELDYWKTGEWQVVDERLKELTQRKIKWNPGRRQLFKALDATPFDLVKCVLVGQDPYPEAQMCTGLAFSIPPGSKRIPATMHTILKELQEDVSVTSDGDLSNWCKEGVLLWNIVPSCLVGKSMSHNWPEYELLTEEMFKKLSPKGIVFVFLGKHAARYRKYVDEDESEVIETTHPSPRGNMPMPKGRLRTAAAFTNSRLFSTINTKLVELGHTPIDWRTHVEV